MSRIGKKPILLDPDIKVSIQGNTVNVKGPNGSLNLSIPRGIKVEQVENKITISSSDKDGGNIHGLFRSLLANIVTGVKKYWTKRLEMVGVGYRAKTTGNELTLHLGFSHPVIINAPDGITFGVSENKITITGADKYLVGETAATIRRLKKPEPYKGKGIRYEGEFIRKKLGKAAKAVGAVGAK